MSQTLRQHRALRRANAHLRASRSFRIADADKTDRIRLSTKLERVCESWPVIVSGLVIAGSLLYLRAGGAL